VVVVVVGGGGVVVCGEFIEYFPSDQSLDLEDLARQQGAGKTPPSCIANGFDCLDNRCMNICKKLGKHQSQQYTPYDHYSCSKH
jgi:hypothetical protein